MKWFILEANNWDIQKSGVISLWLRQRNKEFQTGVIFLAARTMVGVINLNGGLVSGCESASRTYGACVPSVRRAGHQTRKETRCLGPPFWLITPCFFWGCWVLFFLGGGTWNQKKKGCYRGFRAKEGWIILKKQSATPQCWTLWYVPLEDAAKRMESVLATVL